VDVIVAVEYFHQGFNVGEQGFNVARCDGSSIQE